MLFNGLTVTQKNTSETDDYLSVKGWWQSSLPFSLPLCNAVFLKEGSWQLPLSSADKNTSKASDWNRRWRGTWHWWCMIVEIGPWSFMRCPSEAVTERTSSVGPFLVVMNCWLTHCYCWWWNLSRWAALQTCSLIEWVFVNAVKSGIFICNKHNHFKIVTFIVKHEWSCITVFQSYELFSPAPTYVYSVLM